MSENSHYQLLGELAPDSPLRGLPDAAGTTDSPEAMQSLTTAYVTTLYYSALSNLQLQNLSEDIALIDERPRLKIAIDRSYADFNTAAEWLSKNGGEFIAASPAKKYYDEVMAIEKDSIKKIGA